MSHDPLFVMTSIVYAVIGSTMTVMLLERARSRDGDARLMWSILAGIIGGSTIWTAHFISLLGVESVDEPFFFLFISLGALLVSMMLSGVGFALAVWGNDVKWNRMGGLCLGLAITANHVMSVHAMNIAEVKVFDPSRLVIGFLSSVALGMLVVSKKVSPRRGYISVIALAGGILLTYHVGISGLSMTDGVPTWMSDIGIPDRYLFAMVLFFGSMTLAIGVVVFMIDNQSNRDRMKSLEYRAFHDPLTGLPNRYTADEKIKTLMETGKEFSIVTFDLNRFKNINDVHGHEAGDHVLKVLSERISQDCGPGELICRMGGDEFIGIQEQCGSEEQALAFAMRLRRGAVEEVQWEDQRLSVGTSLGIAMFPKDGTTPAEIMVKADLAMYRAKRERHAFPILYDSGIDEPNRTKSKLQLDLRSAIARDELELFYQKQNDIKDGKLIGYEVLLRWNHPERGYVPPDVFIPIAEKDGYIDEIGEWVLRRACLEAASWMRPIRIAVNVAARQLAGDSLPSIVRKALRESGMAAERLEVEITESGIISDTDKALRIVRELKSIGVSIAMDDYGTGYSSLATLQAFPFDKIKIDRAFIRDITDNPQSAAIVNSTVELGRKLDISVLAEGVETAEQLAFLRQMGCSQVQGFFFGYPLPSAHFRKTKEFSRRRAVSG